MRQTHEQRLLLDSSRQTRPQQNRQQNKAAVPSSTTYSNPPPVSNHVENHVSHNPPPGFESMGQAMGNLSVQDSQVCDCNNYLRTVSLFIINGKLNAQSYL